MSCETEADQADPVPETADHHQQDRPTADRDKRPTWKGRLPDARPLLVLAPMVDASELAWRLLARRHGAHITYSPMFHAAIFCKDQRYRKEALQISPEDRPLIIQLCGNKPEILLKAALIAERYCDGLDINLGCPQSIAKRGNYGAFLQDDWPLLSQIVRTLSSRLRVPVSCKVRVFESIERTVAYARMLEEAGCSLLTVHGRTREQKGPLTGLASWAHIAAVRRSVSIPVLGNGNVQCIEDALRLVEETGAIGVMSAEGHLTNPYLFSAVSPPVWEPALEYLDLVQQFPAPNSFVRGHLFKILHKVFGLEENASMREEVAKGSSIEDFRSGVLKVREKYLPIHEGREPYLDTYADYNLSLPPWICQPYVRIPPQQHIDKLLQKQKEAQEKEKENRKGDGKRGHEGNGTSEVLSKKKMKKLARGLNISPHSRRDMPICIACPNPLGLKCCQSLCKSCCRQKCQREELDCPGHRIYLKQKKERKGPQISSSLSSAPD